MNPPKQVKETQHTNGKQKQGIQLIAELAHVSIGTVDRALHGRREIKDSTRRRVLRIARRIGYTPNLAARTLSVSKAPASIGVCVPREIHFFYDQLWNGIVDEGRRAKQLGVRFVNRPVHALGQGDTQAFKELVRRGVQGIILTAGNPKALTPLIDEAEEKGIRVVCVSTDAPDSRRSSIVCVDPWLNGCLAGELMGKLVPPGSAVAVVTGMLTTEDHRKKTAGFCQAFPHHGKSGKVVGVIEGHEDENESFEKAFDLLGQIPTVSGLYVNTVNCLPVCRALAARRLDGRIKLITTDLFAEMSPYFENGTITASIYQRPYRQGQIAVRLAVDNITNKTEFPPAVHLNPSVVMSANMHLFREMKPKSKAESAAGPKLAFGILGG